jgi:hypothetical protein
MSVGWQPDLISLSENLHRYDTLLATLHSRLKNMAKVTAEVASRVGLPSHNFLVQQGLDQTGRQEESRSRSRRRKEKRGRSIEHKQ